MLLQGPAWEQFGQLVGINPDDWRDWRAELRTPAPATVSWRRFIIYLWPWVPAFLLVLGSSGRPWALVLGIALFCAGWLMMWIRVSALHRRARLEATVRRPCPWCGQGSETASERSDGLPVDSTVEQRK